MFLNKKIAVIAVNKKEIKLSVVNASNKTITEEKKEKWNPEDFGETEKLVEFLIKNIEKNKIRILLEEDVHYLLELPFAQDMTRQQILNKISEKIPEKLDEYSWDYKKQDEDKLIAFAPVKHIYDNLVVPLHKAQIEIEAVEPERVAKERHENPIIGIALKKDIKGKDEQVLNLRDHKTQPKDVEEVKNFKKFKGLENVDLESKKNILLIAVTIILLLVSGGILFQYLNSNKELENEPETSRELKEQPEETEEEQDTSTSETEEISREEILAILENTNLLILNGSGVPGEANRMAELLKKMGFTNIEQSDADRYNYEETEVSAKPNISPIVLEIIEETLTGSYELKFIEENLTVETESDVIVVVGKRIN